MNPVLLKIQKEWERTLLVFVLIVVLACLGVFAYIMLNREDSSGSESNKFRTPHVYFDVTSRVYMHGPALDKKARSPMAYSLKVKIPPTVDKPKPADTKSKPQGTKPGDKPKPQESKPKPKPKPVPPPVKIIVKYRGCMQFGEGKPVAFCTSTSSKDKKARPASLHKGDKVHGLITIESFDDKALNLSYNGKKVSVPRGKEHVFTVKQ